MLAKLVLRLLALLFRRRFDRDLEEEIAFHLHMREHKLSEAGHDPQGAAESARLRFGNPTLWKEETREMRTFETVETLWRDARFAVRTLRKSPGFAAVVVFSLALGIGANSTIFSVINGVMLHPLPYRDAGRLVNISQTSSDRSDDTQAPPIAETVDWKKQNHVFEDIALSSLTEAGPVSGAGEAEQANLQDVSPNFFDLLGVKPLIGRVFLPNEVQDTTQTIVITYDYWQRRFHRDPAVLGKSLNVSGVTSTIVGVMPRGFGSFYGERLDLWQPVNPESARYSERKDHWLAAIGRLKSGITLAQAQIEMDLIAHRLEQAYPATNKGVGAKVRLLHDSLYRWAGHYLYPLFGAVCFVLLIACANAANLMQSRAQTHHKEFALRASLGAGRRRLIQQLLVESGLLGIAGGSLGIGLAVLGIRLFSVLAGDFPGIDNVVIDGRVLLFTLAISLLTALLAGLSPALRSSNPHLNLVLREGERGVISRGFTRHILAVSEISLAMVLLVGAGLMINTLLRLHRVDPGFDPDNLIAFSLALPEGGRYVQRIPGGDIERATPDMPAFYHQLFERVNALPGVESSGAATPFGFPYTFSIPGNPAPRPDKRPRTGVKTVGPGYFKTLKIPLQRGRFLTVDDTASAPWSAVVSDAFARRYFPNQDPIGQRLLIRFEDLDEKQPRRIVGVVGNIKWFLPEERPDPIIYTSLFQNGPNFRGGNIMTVLAQDLIVRTHSASVVASVRKAIAAVDPDLPVTDVRSVRHLLERSTGDAVFYAHLLEIFAAVALLLALMGIYGSMSYFVSERTHEIGVRMALGAQRASVLAMIARLGATLAVIGVIAGTALALALTRVIAEFLFGVQPTDPLTFCLVAAVLTVVALAACLVPARRATEVDPMVALRHE